MWSHFSDLVKKVAYRRICIDYLSIHVCVTSLVWVEKGRMRCSQPVVKVFWTLKMQLFVNCFLTLMGILPSSLKMLPLFLLHELGLCKTPQCIGLNSSYIFLSLQLPRIMRNCRTVNAYLNWHKVKWIRSETPGKFDSLHQASGI